MLLKIDYFWGLQSHWIKALSCCSSTSKIELIDLWSISRCNLLCMNAIFKIAWVDKSVIANGHWRSQYPISQTKAFKQSKWNLTCEAFSGASFFWLVYLLYCGNAISWWRSFWKNPDQLLSQLIMPRMGQPSRLPFALNSKRVF